MEARTVRAISFTAGSGRHAGRASRLALLLLLGASSAALGAREDLDCAVGLYDPHGAQAARLTCTDGDPACDTDGACDGTCTFLLRLCVNQCTSKPIPVDRLKIKGATFEVPPLPTDQASCGGYVTVPTRPRARRGRARPGKSVIRLNGLGSGRLKLDKDKVLLVCAPRAGACPLAPEAKEGSVGDLPPMLVDPAAPVAGGTATVTVDVAGASSITLNGVGAGCGGFTTHGPSPSPLVVSQPVGAFGACDLTATVTTSAGPMVLQAHFALAPQVLVPPAVVVEGATFLPGTLPAQTGGPSDPLIGSIVAPGSLINGGTAQLRVQLTNPVQLTDVASVRVQVTGAGGDAGYYEGPAVIDAGALIVGATLSGDFTGSALSLVVQLVDRFGNVGNSVTQNFTVVLVGSGAVQVSLSWDTPTDVDLHVVEPGGREIYWGNRTTPNGGMLDLDSNAACSIDGVNNENVTWGTVAPSGNYVVRVNFWSDCGGLAANYTVTVRACGEVSTYSGSFPAGTGSGGGAGSGEVVATFTTDCAARVRGMATYEDFAQTPTGLSPTSTMLPIRFAKILVKRASDDEVLTEGETKQDGSFDLSFSNDKTPGYYLEVVASQESENVRQTVRSDVDRVYMIRSAGTIDESVESDKTGVVIEAPASGAGPAFNIFDMGVSGAILVRTMFGATPPHLDWLWTRGKKGTCPGDVTCYLSPQRISVLSTQADPDEYDDLVLLHHYGHFFQDLYARTDSPGGAHAARSRVDPRLAWSEGSALFFAALAKGSSLYLDTTAAGLGTRFDIESLEAAIPLATSDGTPSGDVSEALVAAVLWDLADATNETKDTLAKRQGVFAALAYLGGPHFADRGVAGRDLVDALDGWFCRGQGDRGDASSGVEGNVVGLHQFPYDFAAVASCE
jgi:hypothetical protein